MFRIARMEKVAPDMISLVERAIGSEADMAFTQGMSHVVGRPLLLRCSTLSARRSKRSARFGGRERHRTQRYDQESHVRLRRPHLPRRQVTAAPHARGRSQAAGPGAQGCKPRTQDENHGHDVATRSPGTQGRNGIPRPGQNARRSRQHKRMSWARCARSKRVARSY